MDRNFEHRGTLFVWNDFQLQDASRNDEGRDAAIGFSATGRLLTVIHIEVDGDCIRVISARRASASEESTYDQ